MKNIVTKVAGWIAGILAFVLNAITVPYKLALVRKCKTSKSLFNSVLLILISLGDLLVGIYVLIVLSYDAFYGPTFCKMQFEWVTSKACSAIGVLGSVASILSVCSATMLSIFRAVGVSKTLVKSPNVSKRHVRNVSLMTLVTIAVPIILSMLPLHDSLKDRFVNGLYYGPQNPLFIGTPGKLKHVEILEGYYGRMKNVTFDWKLISQLTSGMFSDDYGGISYKKLQFYGNDPVCLFKYLANIDDPQHAFVWGILGIHAVCLAIIAISYIKIWKVTAASSAILVSDNNPHIRKRNQKLQRKIATIIGTNCAVSIPFFVVCALHGGKVFDATPTYPVIALVIIPSNSIINPMILNELINKYVCLVLKKVSVLAMRLKDKFVGFCNLTVVPRNEEETNSQPDKSHMVQRAQTRDLIILPIQYQLTENIELQLFHNQSKTVDDFSQNQSSKSDKVSEQQPNELDKASLHQGQPTS